jgi:ketosteroid isomerase-like protein
MKAVTETNVEVTRRGLEAYNAGDVEAIVATVDAEVELIPMRSLLDGRPYYGHDGIRKFLADMAEEWDEIRIEADEIRDLGDDRVLVLGRFHGKGKASGMEVEAPAAWLSVMRDGKTVLMRAYSSQDEALRALSE